MPDILIRDVPPDVAAALDTKATQLGISRSELLRRALAREVSAIVIEVTVDDLRTVGSLCADLADPEVMDQAWR